MDGKFHVIWETESSSTPDHLLTRLPDLLRLVAQVAGQLCNFSQLAGQVGIDHKTARKYLGVFENLFLLKRIEPWSGNHMTRLVKTPKVQFFDSGLLGVLQQEAGFRRKHDGRSRFGHLLESFVFGEILKQIAWSQAKFRILFFRDKDQNEVDFVLEREDGYLAGLEVKAAASISPRDLSGLRRFRQAAGASFFRGVILYDGTETLPLDQDLWGIPLATLWAPG